MSLPARPVTALSAHEQDLADAALDAFATAIGGRQQLKDTLAVATGSPEIDKVQRLLEDPRYGGWSLRRICTTAGITVADLFTTYRKALILKAHLEATQKIAAQLVGVVDDVMRRAQPQPGICGTCAGTTIWTPPAPKKGAPSEPIACPTCQGTGQVTIAPDLDRQKVALELGQLLQRNAGILVQQNTIAAPGGGMTPGAAPTTPGSLQALQAAVQAVLRPTVVATSTPMPPPGPIEGEVIAQEDPAA